MTKTTITCDGPASVAASLDITEHSRKVSDYIANAYSGGYPGIPARSPYRALAHRLDRAGSIDVRMRLFPYARPILKRFAPFPVQAELDIETADGSWWTLQSVKRRLVGR
jgi:regulation of enolase protein 1 (concanavalin A-like superfamily)